MKQLALFVFAVFMFSACTAPMGNIVDGKNSFTITSNNNSVTIDTKDKESSNGGGCLFKGISFEDETVQLDYIKLKPSCSWTGLADGFYQDFLRKNIKGLEKTSTIKVDNGNIYKFNLEAQYFYLISLYDGSSDIFIIDYEGTIVSKLLEKELSIPTEDQLKTKLKKEFLENYQFKGYFESDRNDESIIVNP